MDEEKKATATEEAAASNTEGKAESTADENLFTQEDVNNVVAKEVAKALKKAAKQQAAPPAQVPAQPPVAGDQAPPPTQPDNSAELAAAQRELLTAKAQIEAIRSGIRADVAEDAVYLALREAEKDGDPDEESIADALKTVLKRHPEWKQSTDSENKPGFRVGAGGDQQTKAASDTLDEIFGIKKSK